MVGHSVAAFEAGSRSPTLVQGARWGCSWVRRFQGTGSRSPTLEPERDAACGTRGAAMHSLGASPTTTYLRGQEKNLKEYVTGDQKITDLFYVA